MSVPRNRTRIIALLLLLMTMVVLFSCTDDLEDVILDNPLDPDNPETGGDPYELTATLGGGGIILSWNPITEIEILGYNLYRSVNDSAFAVLVTNYASIEYIDSAIRNGFAYSYFVVANTADGEADTSNIQCVQINTDPVLIIGSESDTTTTMRDVTLTILAYGSSEMILSNYETFEDGVWETFSSTKEWELTTGVGTKTVYGRVIWANGDTSLVVSDSIRPASLIPTLMINSDDADTPTRQVSLSISATGATEMMISNEPFSSSGTSGFIARDIAEEEIVPVLTTKRPVSNSRVQISAKGGTSTSRVTAEPYAEESSEPVLLIDKIESTTEVEWIPFSAMIDWELATGEGTKTVYLKVRNDFLIEESASDDIDPAQLSPSLTILPADSEYVNHAEVTLSMPNVGATEMKIADTPDSNTVEWIDYQDEYSWSLSTSSLNTVYAWFRNDYFESDNFVSDQMNLDMMVSIDTFMWSTSSGVNEVGLTDQVTFTLKLLDDECSEETDGSASVSVDGWELIELDDQGDGTYTRTITITDSGFTEVDEAVVTANFRDRAGNSILPVSSSNKITVTLNYYIPWAVTRISSFGIYANKVYPADINGDGNLDVVGGSYYQYDYITGELYWWENSASIPRVWTQRIIDSHAWGVTDVDAKDIDGDGDIDILASLDLDNELVMYENLDGTGIQWKKHIISDSVLGNRFVDVQDFDGDLDLDVLSGSTRNSQVMWWENVVEGDSIHWVEHLITEDIETPYDAVGSDMDGDGDIDVVSGGSSSTLAWWENSAGDATSWIKHLITSDANGELTIYPVDLDADGDIDILTSNTNVDAIILWENINGVGTSWAETFVAENLSRPSAVSSADIDLDGTLDVVGSDYDLHKIAWWKNVNGNWVNIDTDGLNWVWDVTLIDLDKDGDSDIIAAVYRGGVYLFENKKLN